MIASLNVLHQLVAIHLGHFEIGDYEIMGLLAQPFQGHFAIFRCAYTRESLTLQHESETVPHPFLIVYDQYFLVLIHTTSSPSRTANARPTAHAVSFGEVS